MPNPPKAWREMVAHTTLLYPKRKPTSVTWSKSFKYTPTNPTMIPTNASSIFRTQTAILVPLSIFSKYTPANPEEKAAEITARNPSTALPWALG